MRAGEFSARAFLVLAEQDADGEEAHVFGVCPVSEPVCDSHRDGGFLQTEWVFIHTSVTYSEKNHLWSPSLDQSLFSFDNPS